MSQLAQMSAAMRMGAIKTLLRDHPKLLEMITKNDGKDFNTDATPEELELIDPGDTLIRIAWDLWNGGGESELDKILHILPPDEFEAFIDALRDFGRLRFKIREAHYSGSEND